MSKKNGKQTRQFIACVEGARSWKMMYSAEKDAIDGRTGVNDLGEAHVFSNEVQTAEVCEATMTKKEHRRAVGAYKMHRAERFKHEEEEYAWKDLKLYKEAFRLHAMLFTEDCVVTKADVDEALEGKSESRTTDIIKQQLNIWRKGAGRKDARTPFSPGNEVFPPEWLLEKLKAIITKDVQVESPCAIRTMVPRPSQLSCAKPMSTLGDELCDALEFQRLAVHEEQKRLDDVHESDNTIIPHQRDLMPELDDFQGKWLAVI